MEVEFGGNCGGGDEEFTVANDRQSQSEGSVIFNIKSNVPVPNYLNMKLFIYLIVKVKDQLHLT
jgi:hypothetical protein